MEAFWEKCACIPRNCCVHVRRTEASGSPRGDYYVEKRPHGRARVSNVRLSAVGVVNNGTIVGAVPTHSVLVCLSWCMRRRGFAPLFLPSSQQLYIAMDKVKTHTVPRYSSSVAGCDRPRFRYALRTLSCDATGSQDSTALATGMLVFV